MKVIICAAGVGSRLGLGIPKCLAKVGGKPLIRWQLDALAGLVDEITVVTGFKHEMVAAELDSLDARIVINQDYATTGVVDSVKRGIGDYRGDVVVVDGDVLFTRAGIERVINTPGDVVCITPNISTSNPVFVDIDGGGITGFNRDAGQFEWAGISKIASRYLQGASGYMFEVLTDFLPMRWELIDSVEIDTPEDLREAEKWINRNK